MESGSCKGKRLSFVLAWEMGHATAISGSTRYAQDREQDASRDAPYGSSALGLYPERP